MVKNPPANVGDIRDCVRSVGWEDPWSRAWQTTPVFLPGESHGKEPGGLQSIELQSQTRLTYSGALLKVFTHCLRTVFLLLLNCKHYLFILDTKPIQYVLQIYFPLCVMFFYVFIMVPLKCIFFDSQF